MWRSGPIIDRVYAEIIEEIVLEFPASFRRLEEEFHKLDRDLRAEIAEKIDQYLREGKFRPGGGLSPPMQTVARANPSRRGAVTGRRRGVLGFAAGDPVPA